MRRWKVEDAKARFSEMLNACAAEGPQLVTKRGAEAAILVPIDEWQRLKGGDRRSFKDVLLGEHSRVELEVPQRGRRRHRHTPAL